MISRSYNFSNYLVRTELRRLLNQIWKLLPMRENEEDWQKQLEIVLNELYGLHSMFGGELDFLQILIRLEGLPQTKEFMTYRSVIFGVISSLTTLANSLEDD